MRVRSATRQTAFSISVLFAQAQPYVAYFHWFRSDMSLFLTVARLVVPAVAGAVMASLGFILSILGAIAHSLVTLFLGVPPEKHYPRVEPKLLVPTLHSRNASTASLYSVSLSQDSVSFVQTSTETMSSDLQAKGAAENNVPQTSSPLLSRYNSTPEAIASGSDILQPSKDVVARGHSPIRRIASQIQEDCKKRRAARKSVSPLQLTISLPPPLSPILSAAEPLTPILSGEASSFAPSLESPRPVVGRAASTPTSVASPKKWLPRRQNTVPAPLARTDPYQAPYFFPTPLSPEAPDYVRQVRISRSAAVGAGTLFEQRRCDGAAGHARTRSREVSVDEQQRAGGLQKAASVGVSGERVGEVEKEKGRLEGLGKLKQLPKRRLSWQSAPAVEEHSSVARPMGPDSAPSSPSGFLRKSRSLLRAPESLTPVTGASKSARSRSGPSPSPDAREGLSQPRKKFSLLEKIHHRRSYSGDKAPAATPTPATS
ncbi:hypothetical protein C8Q72DRAFT_888296 [Fomitopsis betulina]|nr:hypothetical protein C8Q72DRAFT_888296 [Fomitopsis betulina]